MKTQAWGWLAVGVLAAGLNASYHDGGMRWAHRMVGRVVHHSSAVLALATGNAERFMQEARFIEAHRQVQPACQWQDALERAQERIAQSDVQVARFDSMTDRQVAQLQRLQANRVRMEVRLADMRIPVTEFMPVVVRTPNVVCPRVRVNIPKMPKINVPALPQIHVETSSTGPV